MFRARSIKPFTSAGSTPNRYAGNLSVLGRLPAAQELLIGGVVTIVVEIAKRFFGTTRFGTLLFLLVVCFYGDGLIAALRAQDLGDLPSGSPSLILGIWALLVRQLIE